MIATRHKLEAVSPRHTRMAWLHWRMQSNWLRCGGLYAFTVITLAHLLSCACAPFQLDLCRALDSALQPGGRLLGALPREHGKSTLGTVALILRELCLPEEEPCRDSADQAAVLEGAPDHEVQPGTVRACDNAIPTLTRCAAGPGAGPEASPRAGLGRRPRPGSTAPGEAASGRPGRPPAGLRRESKRNILLVCANQQEANAKLRLIVLELERNARLAALGGSGLQPQRDRKGQLVAYGDSEIVLASGQRVRAIGFGAKVRGQLFDGRRPDLIVLDDPEDDRSVASALIRRRLRSWCDTALLNSLDVNRGSLVWLGTLLRHDSVLAQWLSEKSANADLTKVESRRSESELVLSGQGSFNSEVLPDLLRSAASGSQGLTDSDLRLPTSDLSPISGPHWSTIKLAALDENDQPLWPARWSYAALMARKAEIGSRAFAQEYLNQPLSLELVVFHDSDWRTYDPQGLSLDGEAWCAAGEPLTVAIGVDPAIGAAGAEPGAGHDFCAIAVVGLWQPDETELDPPADGIQGPQELARRQPRIYVLEVFRERLPFAQQLSRLERLSRLWRPRRIGIEAVAYQQALSQSALSRGLPAVAMGETRAKALPIEAMARHVAEGRVLLPVSGSWVEIFRREAREYPAGAHDDQLDALARAIECALSLGSSNHEVEGTDERRSASRWRGF